MTTSYSAIGAGEIDADSPITTALAGKWTNNTLAIAEQTSGAPTTSFTRLMHVQEKLAANTQPNTALLSANEIARRDLVEIVDTLGVDGTGAGSVGGTNNTQITLPAGTYWIEAWACAIWYGSNATVDAKHRLYWYNTSDSTYDVVGMAQTVMPSITTTTGVAVPDVAMLAGKFAIAASKTYELRHYTIDSNLTVKGGFAINHASQSEIYADIKIWRTIVP